MKRALQFLTMLAITLTCFAYSSPFTPNTFSHIPQDISLSNADKSVSSNGTAGLTNNQPAKEKGEGFWNLLTSTDPQLRKNSPSSIKRNYAKIRNINKEELYQAVVKVGNGTGCILNENGLVLTSRQLLSHQLLEMSADDNNILINGFSASSIDKEKPIPNLTVYILQQIKDVTDKVLEGTSNIIDPTVKEKTIQEQLAKLKANSTALIEINYYPGYNKYIMNQYIPCSDVRLVAVPSCDLCEYSGSDDLMKWPNNNCDFVLLRLYNNYQTNAKPLTTPVHFSIAKKGYRSNEETYTLGYPTSSNRNKTLAELRYELKYEVPVKLLIAQSELQFVQENPNPSMSHCEQLLQKRNLTASVNALTNIQQQAKQSNLTELRQQQESQFIQWLQEKQQYRALAALQSISSTTDALAPIAMPDLLLQEGFLSLPSVQAALHFTAYGKALEQGNTDAIQFEKTKLTSWLLQNQISPYQMQKDRFMLQQLSRKYAESCMPDSYPEVFYEEKDIDYLFTNSFMTDNARLVNFFQSPSASTLNNDPFYSFATAIENKAKVFHPLMEQASNTITRESILLQPVMREMLGNDYYADSDGSLRFSCGIVKGFTTNEGKEIPCLSTLDTNNQPIATTQFAIVNNSRQGVLPDKTEQFYHSQPVVTNFMITNDALNGSTGSPVFNSKNELIGILYNLNNEGILSNYDYINEVQRSMCVDIRYIQSVLSFIGSADYVQNELK